MPIVEVVSDTIVQRCVACSVARRTDERTLFSRAASLTEPGVLTLAPCACGAVEHLLRTPEGAPAHPVPGSFGHLHRLLVDALHVALGEEARDDEQTGSLEARLRDALSVGR